MRSLANSLFFLADGMGKKDFNLLGLFSARLLLLSPFCVMNGLGSE